MPCTTVALPGGVRAIICTRRQRPRCACGVFSSLQCDAPTHRRSGTCDRHLCAACAVEVGLDRHLCPTHQAQQRQVEPELF